MLFAFILTIASTVTKAGEFKYYKKTFDALNSGLYGMYRYGDLVFFSKNPNHETLIDICKDEHIIIFPEGDIKLLGTERDLNYIHQRSPLVNFNPYTLYWKNKIDKLVKKLVK